MLCFNVEYNTPPDLASEERTWPSILLLHFAPPIGMVLQVPVPRRPPEIYLKRFRVTQCEGIGYTYSSEQKEYAGVLTLTPEFLS